MLETASRPGALPKAHIIDQLGETSLLLPDLVNRALGANERVKYFLTLLQTAKAHADHPGAGLSCLAAEREAAQVDEKDLDGVVPGARREGDGRYRIPEAERLGRGIAEGIGAMIAPLDAEAEAAGGGGAQDGAAQDGGALERCRGYRRRLAELAGDGPGTAVTLTGAEIDAMTHAERERGDSLHLLVMDLHKELYRLQASLARETIEGARVYGIVEADRPLIRAFMTGVNSTAPLKFEHPGLGTTATRAGDRLIIQNDIGTTDAHVLVLHVKDLDATLTYTDLHIQRAQFFQELLEPFAVIWDDTRSRRAEGLEEGDTYYLCVGRYQAKDGQALESYLTFLGSRIVFLIDWNRARKRLGNFLGKKDAIAVLRWAAEHNHGHRAFLQLGGERLVHEAIEHARAPIRYGERLDDVIGREATVDFLRYVLRITAESLLGGRSERLVRDEVKAEFLGYFHTVQQGILGLALDHATAIAELAEAVRDGLDAPSEPAAGDRRAGTARRAAEWERRADELLGRARTLARRSPGAEVYVRILGEADDAADDLEEVAFLMTLLPEGDRCEPWHPALGELGRLLVEGSREFVKCVEAAAHVHRGAAREDVQDFLEAVDRIVTLEHKSDEVERQAVALLVKSGASSSELYLAGQVAARLESAADVLTRSALMLRDHVLGDVLPG
jgi:uncharacterized protein Yka (UPF0111/DUF47 family)